ncbi:MAG: hypothetical protein JOS17DRAFT_736591 [Linnemannia elongata]|nr:MAG: hypothetical protein JOS17DRAFT_736591 [Linnemannia elongata]
MHGVCFLVLLHVVVRGVKQLIKRELSSHIGDAMDGYSLACKPQRSSLSFFFNVGGESKSNKKSKRARHSVLVPTGKMRAQR